MKISIPILLALLLISPALASGENPWQAYTDPNYVSGIAIDGDIIWCATDGGVLQRNRIDGSCLVYTMSDGLPLNLINDIAVDSKGTVWCIPYTMDIASFDGTAWKTHILGKDLPQATYITLAAGENGVVWFGTRWEGIIRYDGGRYTQYTTADGLPSDNVLCVCLGPVDTVWAGTGKGLARFDGRAWKVFTMADGLPGDGIQDIAYDERGNVWVATSGGVARFDGSAWKSWTEADGLGQNYIFRVAPGKNGTVWASLPLWYARFDGTSWKSFPSEPRLHGGGLVVDSDNAAWVDDGSEGLRRFTGDAWERFTVPGLHSNSASEFLRGAVDRNNVKWFGNRFSLASYDGVAWKNYDPVDWSSLKGVTALAADSENRILVGTSDGLFRFDGSAWTKFTEGVPSGYAITSITVSESGIIWIGTGGGLFEFDGKEWKMHPIDARSMAFDRNGILWVATGKDIASFDGMQWSTFPYTAGFSSIDAKSLAVDKDGVKWFGSKGKIISFDNTTWKTWTEQEIGFPLGLSAVNSRVSSIVVDKNNVKWFGTDVGILRFDGVRWERYISRLYLPTSFPYTEAVPVDIGSINGAVVDRNNEIWFGCQGSGVISYRGAMTGTPTSVSSSESLPAGLSFRGLYPNPFNPSTTFEFTLPSPVPVKLEVYSISAQKVATLVDSPMSAGVHSVTFDGSKYASGVYFYRFESAGLNKSGKMLLLK